MKGGIILLLADAALYHFLPHPQAMAAITLASTAINTITDVKWRYVDDQYVFQPVLFSLIYSLQTGTLNRFLILNALIIAFSVALYAIGAWSSGDVTAMTSAGQVLVLSGNTLQAVTNFFAAFAVIYFAAVLTYAAVKTKGKIFRKPPLVGTVESALIASAVYATARPYAAPIMVLLALTSKRLPSIVFHAAAVMSLAYLLSIHFPPTKILTTFAVMYALNFIFSAKNRITFSKKVPASALKEGDVIKEIILEKDGHYIIVEATPMNIARAKIEGMKTVVAPSAEGLKKEDIHFIQENFRQAFFTVYETVPVVPFIPAPVILLFFHVL